MSAFEASILSVLKRDSVVGAAFLVSERLVATCAHVVKSAGGKVGETIALRLSDGTKINAEVVHEYWREESAEDVAILRLEKSIEGMQPLLLGSSTGTKGHTFSTFGFPKRSQELGGRGEIIGDAKLNGVKLLQLDSRQVTPGFSGAPIFDEVTKRIVGIVVAITPPDEYQRQGTTAFAIPSETLREVCPELQISDFCPYRSLEVFNEEDAPFFFGRERVVQKLIDSLKREPRFLAVLGPSGSGKSSVVRAGLIPALKQGKLLGSEKWGIIIIRPASQPFEQLDSAGLPESRDGIENAVHSWLDNHPEKTRLALVIDQFEEVLVSTPEDIRRTFLANLARLLDASVAVTIVLILRSDFYGRFQQDAALLVSWLERGLVNIPPTLTEDEIREMVVAPADSVGLAFEEGLMNAILTDAAETGLTKSIARNTILPLLEFSLSQLWEKRQEGLLTHSAYYSIGGVPGGLSQWADLAYYSLNDDERKIARRILIDLVNFGDETQGIPNTKRVREHNEIVHNENDLSVLQKLVHARLLLTGYDNNLKQNRIEIIHESLLYQWFQLSKWIQEDRDYLRVYRQFAESARDWDQSGRDSGLLYRGARLSKLIQWFEIRKTALVDNVEIDYLEESIRQDKLSQELEQRVVERTTQLEREQQNTETLLRILTEVSSSLDLDRALNRTLALLNDAIGAEQGTIMLLDEKDNLLHYRAGYGYLTHQVAGEGNDFKPKIGEGLAGWVVEHRETALINDLREDLRWVKSLSSSGHRSAIAVPLLVAEDVIGALMVFHRKPNYFSRELLNMVKAIAGQVAVAINNAHLYELIVDQAERLGSMLRRDQEDASHSQAILEAVADGVLVTGSNNRISFLNQSAQQILGLEAGRVIGQSLDVFGGLFGKSAGSWMQTIRDWSEWPAAHQQGDTFAEQIDLENGHIMLVHLAPVILQNDFLGTVSIFRDITHEFEVERLKSEFVATVSHELRTPMISIRGQVDLLLKGAAGELNENQVQFLNTIKNNTERLGILINDLLDISRIESGRVTLAPQPLDLREAAEDVIADVTRRSQDENKPMTLSLNATQDLPKVYADFERVRQILSNLIDNAYRYTPENGTITVNIHPIDDGREVQVDIVDNGIGIPLEDQNRIFERFFRGENPLVLATLGTGLGLSIVKQIVEMHKGRVWFQSSGVPGQGSSFTFTLPIYKSS